MARVTALVAAVAFAALPWGCSVETGGEAPPVPIGETASALGGSYAVCGEPKKVVSGLPWAPCAGMDTECLRGAWDEQSQCCHLVPRHEGSTCATGACDGFGKCIAVDNPEDRDGDKLDDDKDPILGGVGWLRAYGGSPSFWFDIYARDRVELRIDDVAVAVVPTEPAVDLSRIELAVGPKPSERRATFVAAPTPWAEVILDGGEQYEVCFARDSLPPDSPLPADCKGQGIERLLCPLERDDGVSCSFDEGILRLRAPKLRYAWLPIDGEAKDIRLLMLPWRVPIEICPRCKNIPGHLPPPILKLERCNGIDDDDDGRTDEDPVALCDDHLPCTLDSCQGAAGCVHTPRNTMFFCNAGPDCMELRCNEPFEPGEDRDVTVEPDVNGCYQVLKHDFCSDTWDGCACNGRERCDPWRAPSGRGADPWAEFQGCIAETPLTELPCEQLNGDGNGCTTELCCEDWSPTTCRLHRQIQARGTAAVDAYNTACDWPFGEHSSDGELFCPDDPFRHAPDGYGAHCNDGNPCNTDVCHAPSGNCTHPSKPDGEQAGCSGLIGRGCGSQACSSGRCVQSARVPDADDPLQCNDWVAVKSGPLIGPTCLRYQCGGTACNMMPEPAQCDNGLFCDGTERCSLALIEEMDTWDFVDRISEYSIPYPGHYWGCGPAPTGPCNDGVGCTTDFCNESSDTCTNTPDDYVCHTARGVAYDVCSPDFRCECDGPECGSRQPDGCSPLPATYTPCNDGNLCTQDSCTCADEFCTIPACSHDNVCPTLPPGSGGFGGFGGFAGFGGFGG
jgi:hypothetical protein